MEQAGYELPYSLIRSDTGFVSLRSKSTISLSYATVRICKHDVLYKFKHLFLNGYTDINRRYLGQILTR
jgi:hypothetical protein